MSKNKKQLDIKRLCRMAQISRSGYYEFQGRQESQRSIENRALSSRILVIFHEYRQTYGAIRIKQELAEQKQVCGKNRVARLMKAAGLRSIHRLKHRAQTTDSRHGFPIAANVIDIDYLSPNLYEKLKPIAA